MIHRTIKKCLALLFVFSVITHYTAHAQLGNEWIKPSQKYVKIKISADGLYNITYNQIVQAGLTLNTIDPKKLQLFNKGKQVAIMVSGNQTTFSNTDNIIFYGQANDASLDKILYKNPNDLPNDEVSLFEDVNYYFLTYSETENGLRYQNKTISNSGLTPEGYVIANSRLNFSNKYYPGAYIFDVITYSDYIAGEGYLGETYGRGQTASYNLNTPSYAANTNLETNVSFYVAGRSSSNSGNIRGNHHLKITANNVTICDSVFRNYNIVKQQKKVALGNLPAISSINFSSVDDLTTSVNFTDFQVPAYIDISYPRLLDISGISGLTFGLNPTQINSYLKFTNSNIANAIILDNSNNTIYTETKNNGNAEFVLDAKVDVKYILADLNTSNPVITEPVTFKNFSINDVKPFLIVSNKNFSAGAEAYKTYNETRNLATVLAYTDDLYNEFYYGFHHPLAIRNFVKWGLDKGATKPVYLLLLGNGAEYSKKSMATDYVPTIGYPPSDNMLTSGLNGSVLEPGLITGRIPAINNQDIDNYLSKLKIYNQLPDSLWRKNILHISGGKTISENEDFALYQSRFFDNAKAENFGAKLSNIKKNINTPITENQTERVIRETNRGLALISYFGHGASTGTEISFGLAKNYDNKNKPSVYIVNGCSTGDIFDFSNSMAEQFIMQKDYGGIAWIATTSEGVGSELYGATSLFYKNWFKDSYGESISSGFKKGLKAYQNVGNALNEAHTRQYIFVGDPAVTFYSPTKPDYETKNAFLFATTNNQNSSLATLSLKLKIENPGKAIRDSVVVKVTRTLADNSVVQIPNFKVKPVYNTDTVSITLSNEGIVATGNNKITVQLDPDNKINELNENNNQASLDIFLPGNGINLIYPINKGIVATSTVSLEAEPDDLYTKNAEYFFEIDTLPSFNSNFVKKSPIIATGLLPKWMPNIAFEAGKVYFWRARINAPLDKGGAWSTASFTYLPNTADGINISHSAQLQNMDLKNINFDSNTGKFSFFTNLFFTTIQTRGDDASNANERRLRVRGQDAIAYNNPDFLGFSIAAYDNKIFDNIFSYPSPYNFKAGLYPVNGYSGQFFWDINDPIQVDSMVAYINQIPNGYYVMGINGLNITINQLPAYAKNALRSIGLNKFDLVNNGEPYMFWGAKGAAPGSAEEVTADYASAVPARSQLIRFTKAYTYNFNNGFIVSEKIGPAKVWKTAGFDFYKKGADVVTYSIIGVAADGKETTLSKNINNTLVDISNINAAIYPYIKIKADILDKVDLDIPDLKYWRIIYQPVPELTFNPEFKDIFKSLTVQEGDSTHWEIGISNLSAYETEAMNIVPTILKADKTMLTKPLISLPKLAPNTSTTIKLAYTTKGLGGKNNLKLQLQTRNELELYPFNNILTKEYTVDKDLKEPLVNVVFDGKNIINGEIVSPQPTISITTIDDNKFLLLGNADTSLVEVYIKKQDDSKYNRIYYASNQLKIKASTSTGVNKLTVQYINASPFEDGIYTLKVRSKDASGNYNTTNDYTINFECINKSEISNFYPYPNPCTNSMRFVFTLTGMRIPDDIKVTIFTATGKVIREVFKNELGNIRCGNNISDFTWDGTDQYGDRLANGVYFYKVSIKNYDDAQMGRRKTEGDAMFNKNIGKIYLLR